MIVLDVLAGAYRGKGAALNSTLKHASLDGTSALCRGPKSEHLTGAGSRVVTCPRCLAALRRRGGYGHFQSDGTWLAYGDEPEGV
jgi:hypothetical protein